MYCTLEGSSGGSVLQYRHSRSQTAKSAMGTVAVARVRAGTGTGLAPELYGAQGALLRACSGTQRGMQRQAGAVSVMRVCAGR